LSESDDAGGIEACRLIKEELPQTQVIMFTSYGEKSVLSSILAGATGFLTNFWSSLATTNGAIESEAYGHSSTKRPEAFGRFSLPQLVTVW